jgi:hypothetical protein
MRVHNGHVVEWTTHSRIAVKGHHHQNHTLSGTEGQDKKELGHTPSIADSLVMSLKVD